MTQPPFASMSITLKLVVAVVVALATSMLVGTILLSSYIKSEMTNAYMISVDTLAQSLQQGVSDSLERGQMKNFQKFLQLQKKIKGVIEVSLYDRQFQGNLSSSDEKIKEHPLALSIQEELKGNYKPLKKVDQTTVRVYAPQLVTADCVRCHPTWEVAGQGGVVALTFDLTPLHQSLRQQQIMLFLGCLILLLLVSGIIYFLARSVTDPVVLMTQAMERLAAGDLAVKIPAEGRQDEIGKMANAVRVFKENAVDRQRLTEEQEVTKARVEREKVELMNSLADDFETNIGGLISGVSNAVAALEETARNMALTAEQTKEKSTSVARSAEQTSANVLTVASATEELSSSVAEISQQVAQSAEVSRNAVKKAECTNQLVGSLANASQKIGEVVKLITDIAGQTNLLALNATIEAARAGEVGKGFAVVANEVKELAKQTTAATKEISEQITGIQGATREAVDAIRDIGTTIGEINEIAATIAAAVEEQGVVTLDIAQNTQQAANGAQAVSSHITIVAQSSEVTGKEATLVLEAASELNQKARMLRDDVAVFLSKIRTS